MALNNQHSFLELARQCEKTLYQWVLGHQITNRGTFVKGIYLHTELILILVHMS